MDTSARPDSSFRISSGTDTWTDLPELYGEMFDGLKEHQEAVHQISSSIRQFHEKKVPFRIYHGSTNSTRHSTRRSDQVVDISQLKNVLRVYPDSMEARVEPNVPMDQLVSATLEYGLIPVVVPEFPGITVGGAFSGTAGESSSFRHGLFHNTVQWIEIILGDGNSVHAGHDFNSDLYRGARSSFGTLGVLTELCVKLMPAKSHVLLEYHKVNSIQDAIRLNTVYENSPDTDFLDGIMFAKDSGVICVGKLEDMPSEKSEWPEKEFMGPWDPWFYMNAQALIGRPEALCQKEYVPIKDYLFRYDRAAFWMSKYTFEYFWVPNNRFTRWLLNTYTKTRIMYHALHASGLSNNYIIQDVMIPQDESESFFTYLHDNFQHYPIWLCPLGRPDGRPTKRDSLTEESTRAATEQAPGVNFSVCGTTSGKMLNFGIWGPAQEGDLAQYVRWNRALEAKVKELNGRKWLYGQTFYTEEEFWSIYDRRPLDFLRNKYHASHLPTVYDKVKPRIPVTSTWLSRLCDIRPFPGIYGWWKCIRAGDYLLPEPRYLQKKVGKLIKEA